MEKTQQLKETVIRIFGKHEIRCILNANINNVRADKRIIVLCDSDETPLTDAELELFLDTFCVRSGSLSDIADLVSIHIGCELESRIADFNPQTEEASRFIIKTLTKNILQRPCNWDSRYTKSIYITFPYWIGTVGDTWVCMDFAGTDIDTARYMKYMGRASAIGEGIRLFKKTRDTD